MELAIIADDLTGANDTGVQLARYGWKTSVLMEGSGISSSESERLDAIVIDTDSRASSPEEAYAKVEQAARLAVRLGCKTLYKKLDSTLRGNIGAELDAVYEVAQPDFLLIAPAYPDNGRTVIDGVLYVNGVPVHETEVGRDPKTPVTESRIRELIASQSDQPAGSVSHQDLDRGASHLQKLMERCYSSGIRYLVFDARTGDDLKLIAEAAAGSGYSVAWAGSAGMAQCLARSKQAVPRSRRVPGGSGLHKAPVLLVVGSVSQASRRQLEAVLTRQAAAGVELQATVAVSGGGAKAAELDRACREAEARLSAGDHVVLYSSGEAADIAAANEAGRLIGLDAREVSQAIAEALGEAATRLLERCSVQGLVLTGGDTARQVSLQWGAARFELLDEVESGVPLGILAGAGSAIYAVTKAGAFGSDEALVKAINRIGEEGRS
ncbi:four-carbon acid sugar kinase family protein [Paenibacillus puerhi]|uniref:four-carbon acid sugar kinase family protein n=1 Tax=Paenibacillus puerhi TaxID=2692622 RepID=UPI00135B221C|nr:four-carbon acid sugar kinase family protein [Paenibacillus puerhi]